MKYGVSYVPYAGQFEGVSLAWWRTYGEPFLFDTIQEATQYLASQPAMVIACFHPKIVSGRVAEELSDRLMEVMNGRRAIVRVSTGKIVSYTVPIVDGNRPSAQQIRETLGVAHG